MPLSRQLGVVFSLFVALTLIALALMNYFMTKEFIFEFSERNSKNITAALGNNLQNREISELDNIVKLYLESKDIKKITLFDEKGAILYENMMHSQEERSYEWLERLYGFDNLAFESPVESFGAVKVVFGSKAFYEYIWQLFIKSALFFLFFTAAGFGALKLFAEHLVKNIDEIILQTESLKESRFLYNESIFKTKEAERLRKALNSLTDSIKLLHDKNSDTEQKLYDISYRDGLTKLFNRRYFMENIKKYMGSNDRLGSGTFAIFSLVGMDIAKEKLGYKNLGTLLQSMADHLSRTVDTEEFADSLVVKMNEDDFAILIPGHDYEEIRARMERLFRDIRRTFKMSNLRDDRVFISTGVINYNQQDNISTLFSKGDFALSSAKIEGRNFMYFLDEDEGKNLFLGKEEWKELIADSMQTKTLKLYAQPVKKASVDGVVQNELLLRLEKEGEIYESKNFMPVLANFNLLKEIDKYVFQELKELLEAKMPETVYSLNISSSFVTDPLSISWFKKLFKGFELGHHIVIELHHSDAKKNIPVYAEFVSTLKGLGFEFGIDNMIFDDGDFDYIQEIGPLFIKADQETLLIKTDKEEENFQRFMSVVSGSEIDLIAIGVSREKEKRDLLKMGIDLHQGYLMGEPHRLSE